MPNAQAGWFYDEHPRHKVTLTDAFYMAIHEVTQGCYEAVTNPEPGKGKKISEGYPEEFKGMNKPVVRISWDNAERFCKALSAKDKREYALPTEAQWEYACRAGRETPFSFGETISADQANYNGEYTYGNGRMGKNRGKFVPAGSFPPNAWGLYDMHGNVTEWCADRYGNYSSEDDCNPEGPVEGNQRILRGGSWRSYPGACRSAFRLRREGGSNSDAVGFRVRCAVSTESP
jgi:formylglycine-generating enzyme required for sulfatase activity